MMEPGAKPWDGVGVRSPGLSGRFVARVGAAVAPIVRSSSAGFDTSGFYWRTATHAEVDCDRRHHFGDGRSAAGAGVSLAESDGRGGDPGERQVRARPRRARISEREVDR